jgi:hypothetical protein
LPEAFPRRPASDATFTIDPFPALSIAGITARESLNAPVRLIPRTRFHMASVVSCSAEKSSLIPATFASASIVSPAAVTTVSICS